MSKPLLEVKGLSVSFAGKEVVHGIDFSIAPGEKLALVGESGSGKTVTALSLLRLVQNASLGGSAVFQGRDGEVDLLSISERQLRGIRGQDISMIFQEPMTALNPLFSVGDQIAEVLQLKMGLTQSESALAAIKLLANTGIAEPERRARSFPHQLSGGQRQRAMIAMALACKPMLLLADEPTTALDVTVRSQILDLLADLQQKNGMAVLMITHDLNLVRRFATRVAVMENGYIVEHGAVEEVFSNPQHAYTRKLIGSTPTRDVQEVSPDLSLPAVMKAKDLRVSYSVSVPGFKGWFKAGRFVAVQGASFEIPAGQTLGVMGESGSGKSSLALAALGLHPHEGQLEVTGKAWSRSAVGNKAIRQAMQVVFQDPFSSLSPRMTIEEIVGEGLQVYQPGLSAAERQQRVLQSLADVGMLEAESFVAGPPQDGTPPLGGSEAHAVASVGAHSFKTEGKVLLKPGWLAIYGKEAESEATDDKDSKTLVPVKPGERVRTESAEARGLKTRPPARYSEATLLGAMEGAGKTIDDDELREAMLGKGLGTPATRAATIEGLIAEKYMLREGRELIPTAKAFQLMTLLRGLDVQELSKAELTGDWEFKLAQMEQGKLSRETFMAEIAGMTERMVNKAKGYDKDSIPGDYATLQAPCPNCGGVVKENYRRYTCVGKKGADACGFSFGKTPAGRTFENAEVEQFLRDKKIGPLEGFRSKAGWPFTAEMVIKFDEETKNYKLEFDFGDDKNAESGEIVDFGDQQSLGACPKCASAVFEHGKNYVCEKSVPTMTQPTPSCDFKTGQVILQQPIEREQMTKLLATGKTDLLDKFVSMRTRRAFKAMLAWDKEADKVNFEFAPSKFPPRKPAAAKSGTIKTPFGKTVAAKGATAVPAAKKIAAKKVVAKKVAAKKVPAAKLAQPKVPRKTTPGTGLTPSDALAAVIGSEPVARTQVIKKLWDYIKAENLQDAANKRAINADAKLLPVFGKAQVTMFELAGIVGKHLS